MIGKRRRERAKKRALFSAFIKVFQVVQMGLVTWISRSCGHDNEDHFHGSICYHTPHVNMARSTSIEK